MGSDAWVDGDLTEVSKGIDRAGWCLATVTFSASGLMVTHSIGLAAHFGHPELVIAGGALEIVRAVLNLFAYQIADGERFQAGAESDAAGATVRFGAVHQDRWNSGMFAAWHSLYRSTVRRPTVEGALQVLWPDERGRYPGEPGFDPLFVLFQPCLADPAEETV